MFDAENGLRCIVESKTVRGGEGEAELRVQETPAADEILARVFAIDDAVDIGEVGRFGLGKILSVLGGRRPVLPGIGECIGDAFGRRRM